MRISLLSRSVIAGLAAVTLTSIPIQAQRNNDVGREALAHKMFAQKRHAEKAPEKIFKYTQEIIQIPTGDNRWADDTYNTYKYDNFGHVTEQCTRISNSKRIARLQNTYTEYGMLESQIVSNAEEEGDDFTAETKESYIYDKIDHSFAIATNRYIWRADDWALITGSNRAKIERDANDNITSLIIEYATLEGWIEVSRTFYTYENGKAVTMKHYTFEDNEWYLDIDAANIKWERTNGQLTGLLGDYLKGANRIASGTLNYQGEPMNDFVVEYGENGTDYEMTLTYPDGEWAETDTYKLIDDYGSHITEMIVDTYNSKEITGIEIRYDKFGNEILYRKYQGPEDAPYETSREENIYTYNEATGLPESSICQAYNRDADRMVAVSKSLYSDYVEISGINNDALDATRTLRYSAGIVYTNGANCRIYNISGTLVKESTENSIDVSDIEDGIYIARTADSTIRFCK